MDTNFFAVQRTKNYSRWHTHDCWSTFCCAKHWLCNSTCTRSRRSCTWLPPLASCAFRVLLIASKAYCSLTPFRLSHPSKPVWLFFVIFFGSAGVSYFNENWKAWQWRSGKSSMYKLQAHLWIYGFIFFAHVLCVCARGWWCTWLKEDVHSVDGHGGWSDVLRVHWAQLTDKTHWTRQHRIREATGKFALEAHIPRTRTVVLHSALPGSIWHFSRTEWIYYSSTMRHTTQMRSNY